jgi:hypothetical protein
MRELSVVGPRCERYVLGNAGLEELAGGFRWIGDQSGWATRTPSCSRTC